MSEIARLEELEREQTAALQETRAKLEAAQVAEAGVKVGDIVRSTGRWRLDGGRVGGGKRFRVARLERVAWKPCWVIGNPERKDGSFGSAERNLFGDWELAL